MPSQLDHHHHHHRKGGRKTNSMMTTAVLLLSTSTITTTTTTMSSVRAFVQNTIIRRPSSLGSIPITTTKRSMKYSSLSSSSSLAFISSSVNPKSQYIRNVNHKNALFMSTTTTTETTSPAIQTTLGSDSQYDIHNQQNGIIGKYEPQLFENQIYKWWEDAGCFKPDSKQSQEEAKSNGREPYVLPMPPPNVTGRLHMGHAIFVALQDVLARFHRMRGRPVLWLPGTDHAGIATQLQVEKALIAEGR